MYGLGGHSRPYIPVSFSRSEVSIFSEKVYITQSFARIYSCDKNCQNVLERDKLKNSAPKQIVLQAKEWKLCHHHLQPAHEQPYAALECGRCYRAHHTALHFGNFCNNQFKRYNTSEDTTQPVQTALAVAVNQTADYKRIIEPHIWVSFINACCFLATVAMFVKISVNKYVPFSIIFDGASQVVVITEKAARLIGMANVHKHLELTGVHGTSSAEILLHANTTHEWQLMDQDLSLPNRSAVEIEAFFHALRKLIQEVIALISSTRFNRNRRFLDAKAPRRSAVKFEATLDATHGFTSSVPFSGNRHSKNQRKKLQKLYDSLTSHGARC